LMHHMLRPFINLGLAVSKRVEGNKPWEHAFISDKIITHHSVSMKEVNFLFPLYLSKQKKIRRHPFQSFMVFEPEVVYETKARTPNIQPELYEKLNNAFGKTLSPEEILYYIYAVFYSNIYRLKYSEFLRIDFPRVPFTSNYDLFSKMAELGNQLANLHLLKIESFDALISKYQGEGANNRVEKVNYIENEQRVYINPQKYFDQVTPELWNYQVGGYQVLKKYLDDRAKAQRDIGDEKTFCRIVTAIAKTIELQHTIDELYPLIEKDLL